MGKCYKSQQHSAMPANLIHVALYLTHLLENGATHHPVTLAVYVIKWVHDSVNLPDPILKFHLYRKQREEKRRNLLTEMIQ